MKRPKHPIGRLPQLWGRRIPWGAFAHGKGGSPLRRRKHKELARRSPEGGPPEKKEEGEALAAREAAGGEVGTN